MAPRDSQKFKKKEIINTLNWSFLCVWDREDVFLDLHKSYSMIKITIINSRKDHHGKGHLSDGEEHPSG